MLRATAGYNPSNIAITGGTLEGIQKIGFSQTAGGASDASLFWDAVNILAQRNGTSAQAFRLYNTFTDASNYERLDITWLATVLEFGTAAAGTGTARPLRLKSAAPYIQLYTSGSQKAEVGTDYFTGIGAGTIRLGLAGNGWKQLFIDFTNTATVGAVTINKAAGRVNIAAAATSIVVTNSLVTAASKVFVAAAQADANNPLIRSVVPAAGSFTITVSTAPAANQAYDFFVVNAD